MPFIQHTKIRRNNLRVGTQTVNSKPLGKYILRFSNVGEKQIDPNYIKV